ncbi:MAG TPA: hypothetical protein VLC91_00780 [Spongiibacteraceae bacterium]|nr:hypothetical protein [Spongiibacteraceae bacterium]
MANEPAAIGTHSTAIATALQAIVDNPHADPLAQLAALIAGVRPRRRRDFDDARQRWQYMNELLALTPAYRHALREALLRLFFTHRQVAFYADSGLLPNSGFYSELSRKLMQKWLPEPRDTQELRTCVEVLFCRADDEEWIAEIPMAERRRFWQLLEIHDTENIAAFHNIIEQMLAASLVLSHRICAMGLEPELLRVYPRLRAAESPFIAMNIELIQIMAGTRRGQVDTLNDSAHLFVLIEQCMDAVKRARLASARLGTSLALSFLLTRLTQHLERLRLLLQVVTISFRPNTSHELTESWTDFLHSALSGERQHNSVRKHFVNLASILALRITDNAARTGEHYIASNRGEWFTMLRRAGGGGFFIALLALLKAGSYSLEMPPTAQAWLNGILYAGSFAVISMLHLVIATKQPAMTAATLASNISQTHGRLREVEKIVDLVVDTGRSQLAAIAGNIMVAFPVAVLIDLALEIHSGGPLLTPKQALHLLQDLDPLHSRVILHAAIAGVWLFATGLVSGHLDNRAACLQLDKRIAQLSWLVAIIGQRRATATGKYLLNNAGALGGNMFLGLMLGLTPLFGAILGLPLDIRHIALSSANVGYALSTMSFSASAGTLLLALFGLVLVGLLNLGVSFSLALAMAMRSRQMSFWHLAPVLPRLWQRWRQQPRSFFLPPRDEVVL